MYFLMCKDCNIIYSSYQVKRIVYDEVYIDWEDKKMSKHLNDVDDTIECEETSSKDICVSLYSSPGEGNTESGEEVCPVEDAHKVEVRRLDINASDEDIRKVLSLLTKEYLQQKSGIIDIAVLTAEELLIVNKMFK